MKAEQRKELETNTLADKMGRAMQRVKASPRRTFLIYFIVTAVVLLVAFWGYNYYQKDVTRRSLEWLKFYDGAGNLVDELAKEEKDTYAGKAARFQRLWLGYWDFGIKNIPSNRSGAMKGLKDLVKEYGDLAEECKGDPVFEPQALLGKAVAQESRAVEDRGHLKNAKEYYENVVTKYENSGEAAFARKRLEILKDDAKYRALEMEYKELQGLLGIPPPLQEREFKGFPGLEKLKK